MYRFVLVLTLFIFKAPNYPIFFGPIFFWFQTAQKFFARRLSLSESWGGKDSLLQDHERLSIRSFQVFAIGCMTYLLQTHLMQ